MEGADQYEFVLFRDSQYTETWSNSFKTEPQAGYMKFHPDTTYYFGVRAMKTVDGKDYYSDWNYFSHKTPDEASGSAAPQKPSAPENVRTIATGENKAAITWDSVPEATGYQIRMYKDSAYKEVIGQYSFKQTFFNGINSVEGETYHYGIRAVKSVGGQEIYSDWVHFSYTFKKGSSDDLNIQEKH